MDASSDNRGVRFGDDGGGGLSVRGNPRYQPLFTKSHALLIGIGEAYKGRYRSLKAPVGDVKAIEARLKSLPGEWEITTLLDEEATRTKIIDELQDLEDRTEPDDQVLIFYAGHGVKPPAEGNSGWIVPVDGDGGRGSLVSFDVFLNFFERSDAKHILLAMDCCHSGRMANMRGSSVSRFEDRFLIEKAHVILTSGRGDQEVPDSFEGGHSPFASAFLEALNPGGARATTSTQIQANLYDWYDEHQIEQTPEMCYANPGERGQFVIFFE